MLRNSNTSRLLSEKLIHFSHFVKKNWILFTTLKKNEFFLQLIENQKKYFIFLSCLKNFLQIFWQRWVFSSSKFLVLSWTYERKDWLSKSFFWKIDMITIYKSITINKTVNYFYKSCSYFEFCNLRTLPRKAEPIVCVEANFWLEHK